jgi:hypothetical protein
MPVPDADIKIARKAASRTSPQEIGQPLRFRPAPIAVVPRADVMNY